MLLAAGTKLLSLLAAPCRLHFVTNMAVSGGLLLLANFGAGRYTVDAFINKKKE